jgi:hypothetical protein
VVDRNNPGKGSYQKRDSMSTKVYKFHLADVSKNPHFEDGVFIMDKNGLTDESLRSCLICNNGSTHKLEDPNVYLLQKEFKWGVSFSGEILDEETGELFEDQVYQTTDLEQGVKRKRKAIRLFTEFYEPLYQAKKVSCMFFTLTQANQSNERLNTTLKAIKKRFERHNLPVLGHLWVSEVSKNGHWHYHLAIATKRVYWKQIPKWAKVDDLWGRRTGIEFIRKSIGAYLGKYIGKDNIGRIISFRSYGKSRKFLAP